MKIGNNGVPMGTGYKGKGMCKNCAYSEVVNRPGSDKKILYCGWYASSCKQVSRNCSGIRIFQAEVKK